MKTQEQSKRGFRAAETHRQVEREVRRRAAREAAGLSLDAPASDQALAALAEVRASIDELDQIAAGSRGPRGRTEVSWKDVGGSLRLSAEQARRACEKPS